MSISKQIMEAVSVTDAPDYNLSRQTGMQRQMVNADSNIRIVDEKINRMKLLIQQMEEKKREHQEIKNNAKENLQKTQLKKPGYSPAPLRYKI
jgi:hypothetical protein